MTSKPIMSAAQARKETEKVNKLTMEKMQAIIAGAVSAQSAKGNWTAIVTVPSHLFSEVVAELVSKGYVVSNEQFDEYPGIGPIEISWRPLSPSPFKIIAAWWSRLTK
jgi:hypothetical protein